MNRLNTLWNRAKKTLKFVWRHVLSLTAFILILSVYIVYSRLSWEGVLTLLGFTLFFDWLKNIIIAREKLAGIRNSSSSDERALHIREWNNPSVIGSASYNLSNLGR